MSQVLKSNAFLKSNIHLFRKFDQFAGIGVNKNFVNSYNIN